MRRMMSAFVPAGDFEWRKPNFLQSISRPRFWFMRRPRQVIHHVILAPRHIIFKLLVMIATWPHRRRPSATKSSSVLSGHLGKLRLLGLRCRFAGPPFEGLREFRAWESLPGAEQLSEYSRPGPGLSFCLSYQPVPTFF